MYDLICVKHFQCFQKIMCYLPNKIFIEFLVFLAFPLDHSLYKMQGTARSPPSAYSITMQRVALESSKKAVWQVITLGELIEAKSLISFRAESFSLSQRFIILIILIATNSLSGPLLRALTTCPKLPLPSSLIISYQCMEEYFMEIQQALAKQFRFSRLEVFDNFKNNFHWKVNYLAYCIPALNSC